MLDIMDRRKRDYYDVFFSDTYSGSQDNQLMRVDVKENEGAYLLECEVPGISKDNIRLVVNDDLLTINVKREEEVTEHDKYIRRERHYGSMSRSFTIRDIDENKINAKYEDGVLSVLLPKVRVEGNGNTKMIPIE